MTARPSDPRRGGKAPNGVVFAVVGFEHGQQLRDREQIRDALGEVEELQSPTLSTDRRIRTYDLTKTRTVDVWDTGEVQDDLLVTIQDKAVDLIFQNLVAFAERHLSREVQDDDVSGRTFLDLHTRPRLALDS